MIRLLGLLLCTALAWGQRPSDSDAAAIIEAARHKALDYTHSLPDFMCMETIRRSAARPRSMLYQVDVLTVRLRYSHRGEEHKLEKINGNPTDRRYEELTFTTSSGEFGGILKTVFDPKSEAAFDWKSWKSVHKHHVAVFDYAVSAAHSPYYLRANGAQAMVGLHGVLDIDRDTGEVLHMTYIAYEIPPDFPAQYAASTVDYDWTDVGGRNYLLPSSSEMEVRGDRIWTQNKTAFREYRKFSADAVIDFGTGK